MPALKFFQMKDCFTYLSIGRKKAR